jgi:hypothetical protein
MKGLFGHVEPGETLFDILYALRRRKVLRRVSLDRGKKQPKAKSLSRQGRLRQLLRNLLDFRRFSVINGNLIHLNYTTNFASFALNLPS